ncbi:MAG: hypothetical protein N3A58_04315 [Spirochaetes bacterium]|nr:hypothetical protein [Spirochaetota bacterium]
MFGYLKILKKFDQVSLFFYTFTLKLQSIFEECGIKATFLENNDYLIYFVDNYGNLVNDPFFFFDFEEKLKRIFNIDFNSKFKKDLKEGIKDILDKKFENLEFKLVVSPDPFCSFSIGRVFDSPGFIYIIEPEVFLSKVFFLDIFPYISFKYKNLFNFPLSFILTFSFEAKRDFISLLTSSFKPYEKSKLFADLSSIIDVCEKSKVLFNSFFEKKFSFFRIFHQIFGFDIRNWSKNEDFERFIFEFSGMKRTELDDFKHFKEALFYFLSIKRIFFRKISISIVYSDGKIYKAGVVQRSDEEKSFIFTIEKIKRIIIKNKMRDVNIKKVVLDIYKGVDFEEETLFGKNENKDRRLFDAVSYLFNKYGKILRTGE